MYKFLIWIPSLILFMIPLTPFNDNENPRRKKIAENMIAVSTAISFGILLCDIITGYIDIMYVDYSFIKTTIEIFKITWWRVPAMIFCILCTFA